MASKSIKLERQARLKELFEVRYFGLLPDSLARQCSMRLARAGTRAPPASSSCLCCEPPFLFSFVCLFQAENLLWEAELNGLGLSLAKDIP